MESILEPGAAGVYQSGYEPYGPLIQQMATLEHQSHLVLTNRERTRGFDRLERDGYRSSRSFSLDWTTKPAINSF